jgi:SAM-dependent methyltransferase
LTSVRELYELWARGDDPGGESLSPRGRDWLFDLFASLGPQPGEVVLDAGARDGRHLDRLVRDHGLRGIAVDVVPQRDDVMEASIEELPLDDASVDWIWCRDMLVHVGVERALAECARVLKPGGRMLAYVTVATELLEPREAAWLAEALVLATLDGTRIEAAAAAAGLELDEKVVLAGEWRERMIEDGDWDANDALLRVSRLRRGGVEDDSYVADNLWGVYQLLGKLCPTVYVWRLP